MVPALLTALPENLREHLLDQLRCSLAQASGARAPATLKALGADWRSWAAWAAREGESALPAAPEAVAAYLDHLAGMGRTVATLRRHLASLGTLHRWAGIEAPGKASVVRLTLRQLARTKGTAHRQAQGLTWPQLRWLLGMITGDRLIDWRDRALRLVLCDTLGRTAEVAALQVQDLSWFDDGSGVATITRGKSDQEGQGSARFLAADTWRALRAWLEASRLSRARCFAPWTVTAARAALCGRWT